MHVLLCAAPYATQAGIGSRAIVCTPVTAAPGAGLTLLQRLLSWPHLLLPMAAAVCVLLSELLGDAAASPRLPAHTRAHLYRAARAALSAYALPAAEPLAAPVLKAAWAEFCHGPPAAEAGSDLLSADGLAKGAAPAQPAQGGGRQGMKKKRKTEQGPGGKAAAAGAGEEGCAAAVEHSHRPANAQHVTASQVRVLCVLWRRW